LEIMSMQTETTAPAPSSEQAQPAAAVPAAPPAPGSRRRRTRVLIAAGLVLIAAAAAAAYVVLGDDRPAGGDRAAVAASDPANAFKVVLPNAWRSATKEELAAAPGTPLAVLRRDDGRAFVVVRRSGRIPKDLPTFTRDLDKQLEKRFDDFRRQSAKVIEVRAGSAYNYLYVRAQEGTVQTITIVPADRGSFTLNGIAEGGDATVAREVARVIASFDA
jgi:hypothetical protein